MGEKINATASSVSLILGGAKGLFKMKKKVRVDAEEAPSSKLLNSLMGRGFLSVLHLLEFLSNYFPHNVSFGSVPFFCVS